MGKKRFTSKTYLKVLIAVGVLAVIGGGAGTFATFNATTTNAGNTFATGTLVLSNTTQATTCFSTGVGASDNPTTVGTSNTNLNCTAAFNVSVKEPGDTATGQVTLQNVGTLPANALTLTASSCVDGDASGTYHGTGNVCSVLNFNVQEYSDAFTTPSKCWYGGGTATTCNFTTSPLTLTGFGTTPVDISGTPPAFTGNPSAGDTRWFAVAVQLPQSANNSYQGRQATIALTWQESQ